MVPLFITVTFLGLSTAACTIEGLISLKKAKTGATIRYHLGIALFHIGVIIFLLGHLFMEFTGDRLLYALKESVVVNVDEADLTVTLAKSEKVRLSASPDEPERVKLVLHVTKGEESETIQPAELSPAHAFGWDFHLSMGGSKKKGPGTVIEIRRNPGILWLIAGCFVLTGGILLTAPRLVAR
jgi:cytochrome c biogenesis factor